MRNIGSVRTKGNDFTLGKGLLLFIVQNINKDERPFGKTVVSISVHRARSHRHRRDAEYIGRHGTVAAALDDQSEIYCKYRD